MRNTWQLQEAKNQLSVVVENALTRGAQVITRHGEPTAVLLSISEYQKLRPRGNRLIQVLRACPVKDLDLQPVRDCPPDAPL
jgi:prevent-host-death family protein